MVGIVIRRGYQRWAASSPVTCGHDCGLLSPEAVFRGADRVPRSRKADFSMTVVAYRPATPAHRPPGARAGVRRKRRRPEPAWLASLARAEAAAPGAEPGSGADPGSWASAFPAQARQCHRSSATHSPAPALAPRPQHT